MTAANLEFAVSSGEKEVRSHCGFVSQPRRPGDNDPGRLTTFAEPPALRPPLTSAPAAALMDAGFHGFSGSCRSPSFVSDPNRAYLPIATKFPQRASRTRYLRVL